MGEIKSVKVDNWGVFFLQKLQNFFNKTDYCDLTLQFRDNSQLKVHRLVLSACTDYFNVLEQTCEVVDDAIIMPNGLQADVVVPIVNFMYTGTLEFELKMYNRLLRTAKDMNMTVLLKLLEAHRRTMEMHPQKSSGQSSPKARRKTAALTSAANMPSNASGRSLIQTSQGNKRVVVGSSVNAPQNRNVPNNTLSRISPTGQTPVRQIGSTTFTRIKVENNQETNTPTSASGYSLIKQPLQQQTQQPTSPFEQLRKGYNNNKRPAVSTFVSPPAKKPNLEDVKEFAEQQRMRKQIAAEYGDDDYDAANIMDDDAIQNDDDDDEMQTSGGQTQTSQTLATSASASVQTVQSSSTQHHSEDPPGTTTIIVKHEGPDKPPTVVVKDSSNSKMNHAKIISEVLRQYPHLVKSNKNIKLKIMPNTGGQAQKIIVKKELMETEKQTQPPANKLPNTTKISDSQQQSMKTLAVNVAANKTKTMQQEKVELSSSSKTTSGVAKSAISKPIAATPSIAQPQKRRIDSKTMHALIALGAENTTGPWLCLRCGRNGHPISIPSYRGFRRHLINTHKEYIDPDLCEHCGWRSSSKRELHFHMQLLHKIKTNLYIFPECQLCQHMCIDSDGLNQHLIESHPDENKQQCIYCNKIFPEEIQLYTHMKTFHKKQALEDGIIDYSDDENQTQMDLPPLPSEEYDQEIDQEQKEELQTKKVKILSDISLPIASAIIRTDSLSQQQESIASAASEEYLQEQEQDQDNAETKFVSADGSEMILTAEQRKEILSQLNQEHEGSGVVMVLNENPHQQQYGIIETRSDQGAISHDETSQATTASNEEREQEEEQVTEDDQHDDNQIYNEMKSIHSNLDDSTSQTEAAAEGTNEENSMQEDEVEPEQENESETQHRERSEHMEESKESIDNLEWAENLISEHDLADELSPQAINENKKAEEKQVHMKDDDKSQDEISKKLKELTGDWSDDDDDDDDIPEEPITEMPQKDKGEEETAEDAEMVEAKEKEQPEEVKIDKETEENREFEAHAELLASLQNTNRDETEKHKENMESSVADSENIDEDDIDMALKRLHKEDIEDEGINTTEQEEGKCLDEEIKNENISMQIEETNEKLHDVEEGSVDNDDGNNKKCVSDKTTKTTEADGETVTKEEIGEAQALSTTEEVDEETKKELIDSLLNQQAETMEDTAIETPAVEETAKSKNELDTSFDEEKEREGDVKLENELKTNNTETFLETKESIDNVGSTTAASTSESTAISEIAEVGKASTSGKEGTNLSSEEHVKSIISEWGDDDDDEDENDTDLKSNL